MRIFVLVTGLLALLPRAELAAAVPNQPPFREVFEIIRTNLGSLSPEAVDRAALKGLLNQFEGQVSLDGQVAGTPGTPSGPVVSKTAVFDEAYGYVRIHHAGPKLDESFGTEFSKLNGSGKLKGLVIDLRFAGGADEKAAARTVDRFLADEKTLVTVNGEAVRSTTKTNAIQLPLAILVNQQTGGAAELLAALLRDNRSGLLIGATTTGGARQFKEFTLSSGQRLRVASSGTKVAGNQLVPTAGLRPDIGVTVGAEEEQAFYTEPYRNLGRSKTGTEVASKAGSNQGRLNEAELVRRMKEGQSLETAMSSGVPAITTPQVRDPALARALDLLKGIAVVRQSRNP